MLPNGPFNPKEESAKMLDFWLENKFYKPEYNPELDKVQSTDEMKKDPREPWALICPPPNAYARPHIGNISGYAYQDAMARYQRMKGKKVLVLPGKDHAGLEGEGVFVREVLDKKGRNKFNMTREEFYKEIYEFNMENKAKALQDEKAIGLSADFDRDTFTLDPDIVETVLDTFVEMYNAKMIYKGVRIVNWDPKGRSAIADNQCAREERDGKLYKIKYPLVLQRAWILGMNDQSYSRLKSGEKSFEVRALNPEEPERFFGDIKVGDLIVFKDKSGEENPSIYRKVKSVKTFKNLDEAFGQLYWKNITGEEFHDTAEVKEWYMKVALDYDKKIEKNGMVVIEVEDLRDSDYLTVATTRPETLLGDTAVAVNPDDERYNGWHGKSCLIPIVDRVVPIITSYKVEKEFGTGCLKVTPAHAQDDYQIMLNWNQENPEKKIGYIDVIDKTLKLCGPIPKKYFGRKYKEALEDILNELKSLNLYVTEETIKQNVLIAERTKALIEPLMDSQWYMKYDNIKEATMQMVQNAKKNRGEKVKDIENAPSEILNDTSRAVQIHPENMEPKFEHWMTNLRDWAISRSLWWGYRLPVWYHGELEEGIDENGQVEVFIKLRSQKSEAGSLETGDGSLEEEQKVPLDPTNPDHIKVQKQNPGEGWIQDENVLDTWFSSGQWVYATLTKWNLMDTFFPTNVLVSAHDILENWDSRMMMFTYFKHKNIPFHDLFLTGLVLGTDGQKMSKSKGNMIDMDKVVAEYGADAVRLSYFYQNSAGASYAITNDKLKNFKQFNNKIWNAAKFVLMNSESQNLNVKSQILPENLKLENSKKILEHINNLKQKVTSNIDNFEFGHATDSLYTEFWHTFCDVQIEESKKYFGRKDSEQTSSQEEAAETASVLLYALKEYLKMLHPFIPFITERIWQEVPKSDGDHKSLMYSAW